MTKQVSLRSAIMIADRAITTEKKSSLIYIAIIVVIALFVGKQTIDTTNEW
jgi:hypothetical protein